MAKADTVYSLFGLKTPQQVAREQLQRQQALIARSARDPYQLAGASIGTALGRLFGGPSKEMEQAQEAQEVMQNFNEFGAEVCLLYTSPSPRDGLLSRMPSSA